MIINAVKNLTINDARNDLINKVTNMTINNARNYLIGCDVNMIINVVGNNLIGCITNMKINNVINYLNRANASDLQVKYAGNTAVKNHQNLLSSRKIGI